jgi:hypothetical protein
MLHAQSFGRPGARLFEWKTSHHSKKIQKAAHFEHAGLRSVYHSWILTVQSSPLA